MRCNYPKFKSLEQASKEFEREAWGNCPSDQTNRLDNYIKSMSGDTFKKVYTQKLIFLCKNWLGMFKQLHFLVFTTILKSYYVLHIYST